MANIEDKEDFYGTLYHEKGHDTSSEESYADRMRESGTNKQKTFAGLLGNGGQLDGALVSYTSASSAMEDIRHLAGNTTKARGVSEGDRLPDDYVAKKDGTIEVVKTDDKFDRFYVENKDGDIEFIGQFDKNESELIALPNTLSGNGFGFQYTGSQGENYISGIAFAALLGSLKEIGFYDISLNHWSNTDGSSPFPSKSHKNGNVGDIRPLRLDFSGNPVTVDNLMFDKNRNASLISSLKKFGWKDILSERNNDDDITPNTRHFSGYKSKKTGKWIKSRHHDHFHIQGFRPKIINQN